MALSSAYADLFAPFEYGTCHRPFIVAQLGQSLDGRIATANGDSKYINGSAALDHLHRIRAHVDAVVVGVGTVLADDPLLTVRRVQGRSPARIIIDPNGRLPPTAKCLAEDGAWRCIVRAKAAPVPDGVDEIRLDTTNGALSPQSIITALGQRGFRRILVEGGSRTISAFLEAGVIDRLHVLIAPVLLGSGKSALELKPVEAISQALRPAARAHVLADGDVLFDCDMRRGKGV